MCFDCIFDGLEQAFGGCYPFIFFGVDGTNGSENLTVGPENWKPKVSEDTGFCRG
jgi:hypothetical protein